MSCTKRFYRKKPINFVPFYLLSSSSSLGSFDFDNGFIHPKFITKIRAL